MTDGRFSGGSVGLVIDHVGPEAAIGGPIALVEEGDEIIVDLNSNEINCIQLSDNTTYNDAMDILNRYNLSEYTPPSIIKHIESGIQGHIEESPSEIDNCTNKIISSNRLYREQLFIGK